MSLTTAALDPDAHADRLRRICAAVPEPDWTLAPALQAALDGKTKPQGSLGRLEALAAWYARLRGQLNPPVPRAAVVVMAADHGVTAEGVSAFPAEVTGQMVANFARGGAAINVLARHEGLDLQVLDIGVAHPVPDLAGVRVRRVRAGTRNMAQEPAMTRAEVLAALAVGLDLAAELNENGVGLVGLGEMGIGNTTAASALTLAWTAATPEQAVGRGTGLDDEALVHKRSVVAAAVARHAPDPADPLGTLAALGGLEIAGLAGLTLGCAARRIPVVSDGFIATAAVLAAVRLCPAVQPFLLAAHQSVEPGHRLQLEALGLDPLFDLGMRLGEGTGAALACDLVRAAVRILAEMATFGEAGVQDRDG